MILSIILYLDNWDLWQYVNTSTTSHKDSIPYYNISNWFYGIGQQETYLNRTTENKRTKQPATHGLRGSTLGASSVYNNINLSYSPPYSCNYRLPIHHITTQGLPSLRVVYTRTTSVHDVSLLTHPILYRKQHSCRLPMGFKGFPTAHPSAYRLGRLAVRDRL